MPLSARVSSIYFLYFGAGAVLCVSIFANYVLHDLGPDEGMYLGASYLAVDQEIYAEFSFFQTPYLPLAISSFFDVTGVRYPLLWGRIIAYIHHLMTLFLIALIAFRYTKNIHVAGLLTLVVSLNRVFFDGASTLHNTTFATTYAVLGFFALLIAYQRDWASTWWVGVSGLSVALAVGFKLTYLPVLASFTAVIIVYTLSHRTSSVVRGLLLPYVVGTAVGLLPLAWIAAMRFDAFAFNNVSWHARLMGVAVEGAGSRSLVLASVVHDMHDFVDSMKGLGLWVLLVPLVVALGANAGSRRVLLSFDRVLLATLVVSTAALCLLYVHVAYWYLGAIVLFAALVVPSVYAVLDAGSQRVITAALAISAVYMILVQLPIIDNAAGAFDRDQWIPLHYARTAEQLDARASVAAVGNAALVYAVEAELPLASWSPTSAFTHQSSLMDTLSFDEARRYHVATYRGIEGAVERGELDMLIISNVYAEAEETRGVVEALRVAGFEMEIMGEGAGRVVVYRAQRRVR